MAKQALMTIRVIALFLGLSLLGGVWTILTYVTWGIFTFFGMVGGTPLSAIIVTGGIISYVYIAFRLFQGGRAKGEYQMAGARKPGLMSALAATVMFSRAGIAGRESTTTASSGRSRAAALAKSWARHVGAPDRALDASGDMALGDSGLTYDADKDTLVGRVYVTMALIKNTDPEAIVTQRRMVGALNDPKIGGMYDRGGGAFVLDEEREAYYLVRAFPVADTTPTRLERDMKRMLTVAPTWTVKWFFDVAMMMHGKKESPTEP